VETESGADQFGYSLRCVLNSSTPQDLMQICLIKEGNYLVVKYSLKVSSYKFSIVWFLAIWASAIESWILTHLKKLFTKLSVQTGNVLLKCFVMME